MKKKFWLGTLALAATLCLSVGAVNVSYTANAEDVATESTVEETTLDLLDGANFDSTTDSKLVYDTATKTGSANAPSGEVSRYFSYITQDYVTTADGVKPFAGMAAEYSVTYTNIGTLNAKADTNYLGVIFQVDGYQQKYRVGSALNYGGSDYLVKRADENSPFVVEGNKRNLKSLVVTEENPTATIVFKFTPKVGDVDGSFEITVNGVSAGSYAYTSTSLPTMGLLVGKNSANISNASIKILGATGWYADYDLLSDSNGNHTLSSDGATTETKYSYDFATKTGYIGGSESGIGVAASERATAYFDIDAPDKVVASDGTLVDYSSLKAITVNMTFSDVVAADGTFDADNNNEFVAIRLLDNESKQQAAAFVMNKAKYGHFGVFERTNNEVFGSNFDTGNVRFGGSTSPWADGKLTISLKITLATETQAGRIEVILNGNVAQFNGKIDGTSTTIAEFAYEGKTIPKFGMYARGVYAKVSNVSYILHGVQDVHEHTEETLAGYAATCTTDGLTEGKKCSVCDMTLVAQETIPAAHTTTKTEAVAPTCTEAGNIAYWTCSGTCGKTYSDEACTEEVTDTVLPAAGHKTTKTDAQAATCTEGGWIDFWFCNVCSKIYSDEAYTTEITAEEALTPATGHTEETLAAVAPTCTETGLTEGKKCSVCEETLVAQEEVAATGHTEETLAAVAATCTTDGLTEGKKCSVCEETLVAQEVIPAAHTEETIAAVAPTCTATGLTEGKKCSVCGETLVAQEEVAAVGHTESEWIIDKEAQVGVAGSKHKECTVCGETLATESIPALEDTSSDNSSSSDDKTSSDNSSSSDDKTSSDNSSSSDNNTEEPKEDGIYETVKDMIPQQLKDLIPVELKQILNEGCGSVVGGVAGGAAALGMAVVAIFKKKRD